MFAPFDVITVVAASRSIGGARRRGVSKIV
jgi:hypothetical protein